MATEAPIKQKRASRYYRPEGWDPANYAIAITGNDLKYLHTLFIQGPTRASNLHALDRAPRHYDNTKGRLQKLWMAGYVDRPLQQKRIENHLYKFLVYELSDLGLDALFAGGRISEDAMYWYGRINRRSNSFFHDVMASDVVTSLRLGCRKHGVRFISDIELLCELAPRKLRESPANPYTVVIRPRTSKTDQGEYVRPDYFCGLGYPKATGGENYLIPFLEVDRATEQSRDESYGTDFKEKIVKYEKSLSSLIPDHFGIKADRVVLTVSTSPSQIDRAIRAAKKINNPQLHARMLFVDLPDYRHEPDPSPIVFETDWRRANNPNLNLQKI